MVEQVVQVVQLDPLPVARRQRPRGRIADEKGLWEAAEQLGHRQIYLPVAAVHGRIEQGAAAPGQQGRIAAPQVAMHQAGLGRMACQPGRYSLQQCIGLRQPVA